MLSGPDGDSSRAMLGAPASGGACWNLAGSETGDPSICIILPLGRRFAVFRLTDGALRGLWQPP